MSAIDARTQLFGIFGHPVKHSLSPDMHNQAFRALGLNARYMAFDVHPEQLRDALRGLIALGIGGVNLTIPHKEAALPLMDELDEGARLIGAINTVVNRDGRLIGYNTDGEGFLRSLIEEALEHPRGKNILMLGAGGSARAVAMTLALAGAQKIWIANRKRERADELARDVTHGTGVWARGISLEIDELRHISQDAEIIIHTSPVGMYPDVDAAPIIQKELIDPGQLVCDLIYNPEETGLLRMAKERGARTLNGLGMLLFQGVLAFEKWTGTEAPTAVMRQALVSGLQSQLKRA